MKLKVEFREAVNVLEYSLVRSLLELEPLGIYVFLIPKGIEARPESLEK